MDLLCKTDTVPSVAEIVSLDSLALEPVVLPHSDAVILWVATSELPDPTPYLEGGELLLTTGMIERSDLEWADYTRGLLAAGTVALGFGIDVNRPQVPAALSAAARDLGLNLFIVPRPTPFIAVSRAVAELLSRAEYQGIRESLLHQQGLTKAAASPRGNSAVLETLAEIVNGEVLLTDARGSVLAASISRRSSTHLLVEARPLIARLVSTEVRGSATDITSRTRVTVHPVGTGSPVEAYLVLETIDPLLPSQRSAITTAIALLALDRRRAHAERKADRRLRAGVYSLLLQGELGAAQALLGETAPGPRFLPARILVVRARGRRQDIDLAVTRLESAGSLQGAVLAARLDRTAEGGTETSEYELGIIAGDRAALRPEFQDALVGLEAGISSVHPLANARDGAAEALEALALATQKHPIVHWSELAHSSVDALLSPTTLRAFAAELLGSIFRHKDGKALLDSLQAFLLHNGQIEPAARSLGIHRNTLAKRLSAAAESLGRSLDDPQLRVDLWVALKAAPAQGWNPEGPTGVAQRTTGAP